MKKVIISVLSFLQRFQYEIAIFGFLLIRGLPPANFSTVIGWQSMSYVLSYKYGFCSRFLIGSIIRLFNPNYVSAQDIALFVNSTAIFDCLITALVLGAFLRCAQKRGQLLLTAIPVAIYLTIPINISIYFSSSGGYAGKLEMFLFPLMVLSAWVLLKTEPGLKQTALVSVISIIAILIYQNYIFLCFPLILAILVLNLFSYGWTKNNILHSLIICAVNGIFFIYIQLFAKIDATDAIQLAEELQSQTDMAIVTDAVFYEYFASFSEFFIDLMLYRYDYELKILLFDLILLLPAIAIYVYIWLNAFASCSNKKDKWILGSLQLCSFVFLPTYIITCDWARWSVWFIMFQVALVLILLAKYFTPMVDAMTKTLDLIKQYKALFALVLIYFLSLTVLSVTEMFVMSKMLFRFIFER